MVALDEHEVLVAGVLAVERARVRRRATAGEVERRWQDCYVRQQELARFQEVTFSSILLLDHFRDQTALASASK